MWASSEDYKHKKNVQRVVFSRQGYSASLLIANAAIRRIFSFPTAGKKPSCEIIDSFLSRYGNETSSIRAIHVDQEGELTRSYAFQETIAKYGYILEPTGSDASS